MSRWNGYFNNKQSRKQKTVEPIDLNDLPDQNQEEQQEQQPDQKPEEKSASTTLKEKYQKAVDILETITDGAKALDQFVVNPQQRTQKKETQEKQKQESKNFTRNLLIFGGSGLIVVLIIVLIVLKNRE